MFGWIGADTKPFELGSSMDLLRVCRQIYGEAALLPYSQKRLIFEGQWTMKLMIESLQPAQRQVLGNIYTRGDNPKSPNYLYVMQYEYNGKGLEFVGEAMDNNEFHQILLEGDLSPPSLYLNAEARRAGISVGHEAGGMEFLQYIPLDKRPTDIKQAT